LRTRLTCRIWSNRTVLTSRKNKTVTYRTDSRSTAIVDRTERVAVTQRFDCDANPLQLTADRQAHHDHAQVEHGRGETVQDVRYQLDDVEHVKKPVDGAIF